MSGYKYSTPEEHRKFQLRLVFSLEGVLAMARHGVLGNQDVTIPGMAFSARHSEWREYSDEGWDLVVGGISYNVKVQNRSFTSAEQFASPYAKSYDRPLLVCAAHIEEHPDYYLHLNREMTGGWIVSSTGEHRWGKRWVTMDGGGQNCRDCLLSEASWLDLRQKGWVPK